MLHEYESYNVNVYGRNNSGFALVRSNICIISSCLFDLILNVSRLLSFSSTTTTTTTTTTTAGTVLHLKLEWHVISPCIQDFM